MLCSCLKSRPSCLTVEAYDQGVPETTSFACHCMQLVTRPYKCSKHVACVLASIPGCYKEEKHPGFEAKKKYILPVHNKYISPFFCATQSILDCQAPFYTAHARLIVPVIQIKNYFLFQY